MLIILALAAGCSDNAASHKNAAPPAVEKGPSVQGCRGCHPLLSLDKKHDLPCGDCHRGDAKANTQQAAHTGLIQKPAHPDRMMLYCGKCHEAIVRQAADTLHFTLAKEINLVRRAFGGKPLPSLTAIPQQAEPKTSLQLAEDLLRRRCLRCHLYSAGDAYAATRHATGCAACHLALVNGSLEDHRFLARPGDQQCLSCHYGNRVGADYYGRFEHDVNWDYQTPFPADAKEEVPPYGIGYHQLSPDLHQQAGMACIDCHDGRELMAGGRRLTCLTCHGPVLGQERPQSLTEIDGRRQLTTASSGKRLEVPLMKDPAHDRYGKKVACQVCHAQWSFADHGDHLLRLDTPDYESWKGMTRQGSSEVEQQLGAVLFQNAPDQEPTMTDGITGAPSTGLWLQAYELRRWEEINTCFDEQSMLQVCRPLLDLRLSYVNRDGEVVINGAAPVTGTPVLLPYTPHTTGRAGAFYRQRLSRLTAP